MKTNAHMILGDAENNFSIPLSSTVLTTLIDLLPDDTTNSALFEYLASHADSAVRAAVADKEFLPVTAVKQLLNDPALGVLKRLLNSQNAREHVGTIEALALCRRDPELATKLGRDIENFSQCDESVISFLETHADTKVRLSLATNCLVPKWVLQRLAQNDVDPEVRDSARYAMS
ncbi:MAG: hypothetical protein IPJ25_02240 [Rhodocyclaceae bacterium]|nr:hypothetical protein [Rhodocyclaceae bacterium]